MIDFTVAYAPFFQAVFGPKDVEIKSFEDLGGKTLSVTRGTIRTMPCRSWPPRH